MHVEASDLSGAVVSVVIRGSTIGNCWAEASDTAVRALPTSVIVSWAWSVSARFVCWAAPHWRENAAGELRDMRVASYCVTMV